jgi:hypothetical protein
VLSKLEIHMANKLGVYFEPLAAMVSEGV